ncbi:MAG TPA: PqqD family protein [Thermoanaerobaculia bacterium]|nr:PqqD family protein [Thermoanaerobaculia bacterium]
MTTLTGIDGRSVFRRSDDVVCRAVGRESILVPIRNNVGNLDFVYTLSPVAARIWSLLDGVRTADEVAEAIMAEYEVDRDTVMADLAELVSDLAGVSLLSRVS